ncbi:WGxxGxxG family protein [Paenibacillus sp. GCM10023250]|uniref:WGxxGxxG family protein n=1 Tax=Paenibacillus sp. GCM10023250 TaxID=3252648 RepID=UPI00360757D5
MKHLLCFAALGCFALLFGAGMLSAAGKEPVNSMTSPTTQSYDNADNRILQTNMYNGNRVTGGDYRAAAVDNDNDFDWGWLGLLGLIGLAGLRGRNHDQTPERS